MLSDLPSNLRSARHERLKIFAFVDDLIDDHDALITTCKILLRRYLYRSKMATTKFQSEKLQKWLKQRFICHERNRIHPLQRWSPLWTTNCIIKLYVFVIEPIQILRWYRPLACEERFIGKSLNSCTIGAECCTIVVEQRYGGAMLSYEPYCGVVWVWCMGYI